MLCRQVQTSLLISSIPHFFENDPTCRTCQSMASVIAASIAATTAPDGTERQRARAPARLPGRDERPCWFGRDAVHICHQRRHRRQRLTLTHMISGEPWGHDFRSRHDDRRARPVAGVKAARLLRRLSASCARRRLGLDARDAEGALHSLEEQRSPAGRLNSPCPLRGRTQQRAPP
jgi:hypothetical protein